MKLKKNKEKNKENYQKINKSKLKNLRKCNIFLYIFLSRKKFQED